MKLHHAESLSELTDIAQLIDEKNSVPLGWNRLELETKTEGFQVQETVESAVTDELQGTVE